MSLQKKYLLILPTALLNIILTALCINSFTFASEGAEHNISKFLVQLYDLPNQLETLDNNINRDFSFQTQSENSVSSRIISGSNASRGEYGEFVQVFIVDDEQSNIVGLCSGSLIAPNKVLTAGHCSLESASNYLVVPGFYSFNDQIEESDIGIVSRVRTHPNYNDLAIDYDIGILTLTLNFTTPLANVYAGNDLFVSELGTAIGTGLIATNPPENVDILQEVSAPIISNQLCSSLWQQISGFDPITDRMMCAGFPIGNRGTCSGDSGGGLFVDIDGQRTIVGTTSFGLMECEANRQEQAYARVSTMTDFIRQEAPTTNFVFSDSIVLPIGALFLLLNGDESE